MSWLKKFRRSKKRDLTVSLRGWSLLLRNLPKLSWQHKWDIAPFIVILIAKVVLHGLNFTEYPYYENDEATYAIRGLSFIRDGSMDQYTYWYDHAPAGWIFIGLWYAITGEAELFGSLLNSARFFIFLLSTASALMVYQIGKKIFNDRWFATMAAVLFIASPLSIYFQRRVLLDNVMVFWTLSALMFALNKPMRLRDSFLSGLTFSFAVLTKLNAIFFAPAFLFAVFLHSPKKIRSMSLALWASTSGTILMLFPLYALLKGELFSKNPDPTTGAFTEGISLIDSLSYQSSRGTADGLAFYEEGSSFYLAMTEWASKDMTVITFTLAAASLVGLLFFKRYRQSLSQLLTVNLVLIGMLLFLARGGVVLEFYFIPIVPFAYILVMGMMANPLRWESFKNKFARGFYRVGLAVCVFLIITPGVLTHQAFRDNETDNMIQAVEWLRSNVAEDSIIASDNYANAFLNVGGNFRNLHYNFKFEYDPDLRDIISNDWRNIDYILLTHEVLKQIRIGETPIIREAFDHSVEIASFTKGTSSYNNIEQYISTNGDWVKIYEVKKDNEIIRQQSWQGFLDNHFTDYGRIVDNKVNQVTTSQYQSNSLVRALAENERSRFDGIWSWTRDHLQNRSQDKLISRLWEPDELTGELGIGDPNSDALADLEIAYALQVAADKWGVPEYAEAANEILADYWQYEVVSIAGKYYVQLQKVDQVTAPITVSPGYAALPYMEYFAGREDSAYDWQGLLDDSYDLLARVQNPQTGLFPNWVQVSATGQISPATTYAPTTTNLFGYEAFRVPYWLSVVDDQRANRLLLPYGLFVADIYAQEEFLPAVISTDGTFRSDFDDTLMYGAAYEAIRLVDTELADEVMRNQITGGGFDEQTGLWARAGSNVYNQLWLPLLIDDLPDLSLAPALPDGIKD